MSAAKSPMMAITTSNSIRVKANRFLAQTFVLADRETLVNRES
jgi:hypothetical protein